MRLDKFLADSLSLTRSDVKKLIKNGKVALNGVKATKADIQVGGEDAVTVKGKELAYQEFYYYMFYKPAGCVTANEDANDKTVFDYLKGIRGKGLSAVGRLDKDTEGLLIITNDGELNHRLMAPGKHVEKSYLCILASELSDSDVEKLRSGVDIGDDKPTLPARCEKIRLEDGASACMLAITEGRFHQVKRMLKAVGNEVLYLKRTAIGDILLDESLEKGSYRELTEAELSKLL